jgi:hypothetical protein
MSALPALKNPIEHITEQEYWEHYYNDSEISYEWNNGCLEEKHMSDFITYLVYRWFQNILNQYLTVNPIAEFTGLEMGFRLQLPNKVTIRKPDLGVVLNNNPVALLPTDRTYNGIFDMCIEALSDSSDAEIRRDTIVKKAEYANVGIQEYYILYGLNYQMEFYRLHHGLYIPIERIDGDIIQSSVLPGFQFRISDLHNRPSFEAMMDDPVYQSFILPDYRQEKIARRQAEQKILIDAKRVEEALQAQQKAQQKAQQAEQAKQQAEQKAQQAEQAKRQAERLAKTEAQRAEKAEQRVQQTEAELARLKALLAEAKQN